MSQIQIPTNPVSSFMQTETQKAAVLAQIKAEYLQLETTEQSAVLAKAINQYGLSAMPLDFLKVLLSCLTAMEK